MKPLAIDLYCGLGGWTEGLLLEGYRVIGYDIEDHRYGDMCYPGELVLQDVLTLHGSQFKDAALIVGSSPCQEFSYRAMPWKRAKALGPPHLGIALFNAQFRIQREASEAAGRHIPMVVENVRGAIPWVGRSRWNYGSYHLWGDVPALMPPTLPRGVLKQGVAHRNDGSTNFHQGKYGTKMPGHDWSRHAKTGEVSGDWRDDHRKNDGDSWFNIAHNTTSGKGQNPDGRKTAGAPHKRDGHGHTRHLTNPLEHADAGNKGFARNGKPLGQNQLGRVHSSKSVARKMATAMISKIPLPLSRHIARVYYPTALVADEGRGLGCSLAV